MSLGSSKIKSYPFTLEGATVFNSQWTKFGSIFSREGTKTAGSYAAKRCGQHSLSQHAVTPANQVARQVPPESNLVSFVTNHLFTEKLPALRFRI